MSSGWIDKPDNPQVVDAQLTSQYTCGALAAVNFAALTLRVVLARDFASFAPVTDAAKHIDPSWLRAR